MNRRQTRQLEAEVRTNRRAGLSPKQQLMVLDARGVADNGAVRERERLLRQIQLSAEKPVQPKKIAHQSAKGRHAK